LASDKSKEFWDNYFNKREKFSDDFKDLFQKMISLIPENRPAIDEILAHPWMNGKILS